ncbi:MAG: nucleoside deaminase [Bacilli bacterium]|nr:nucleoside deaminase [Bacilli bacterium]MBQ6282998.1 nucleoside deaminase [Bacilli bacterium]
MKEYFMKEAIREAIKAKNIEEIPVGAVIVYNNKIIARAYNKKEKLQNSLMHAELIAINKACKKLNSWRLNDCEIYVTLEPCNMCMAAIIESRIGKIYYGIDNFKTHSINNEMLKETKINIESGILESKCKNVLNDFFKNMRGK